MREAIEAGQGGYPPQSDDRRTLCPGEGGRRPALSRSPDGTLTVGSVAFARQLLRSGATRQAGFNADLVRRLPQRNTSVLFREGEDHRRQRAAVARFFAPAAVATRYRPAIERGAADLIEALLRDRSAVLDEMTLALSAGVAAEIVGLTESRRPGLPRRLGRVLEVQSLPGGSPLRLLRYLASAQAVMLAIYWLDVRPSILARRRSRRPDLVSSLLDQGWSQPDILTECITYATAGISTTREFIVAAALHLLDDELLRNRFLAGEEEDRVRILEEILRLEPAVSTLYRRACEPIRLGDAGDTLEPGQLVAIDIRSVNGDEQVVGPCPFRIDPDRRVPGPSDVMGFGDGPHRCPGAAVALLEAAIFLDRLLRLPGIRLSRPPEMSRHPVSTGYVLRGAVVAVP